MHRYNYALSEPVRQGHHDEERNESECLEDLDIPEYLADLGIYVDGSATSIADAICDIAMGRLQLDALGERLRARALAELDYSKIAAELSREYSRIGSRNRTSHIQQQSQNCGE